MKYNLLLLPDVEEDLIAGYIWSEGESNTPAAG